MNNESIANKNRPQIYDDVIGQEATVSAIRGKIRDRKVPRVSLYCGSHGSGKTTIARITAKAVNCQNLREDGNPCCQCESCKNIDAGISSDVIELDAASHNKVEDAESIVRQSNFLPIGNFKVFILDEFHMMTKEAQNKLLKQVEEPPAHVIFIFCTTEENRVLPTILSRCNKFSFKSICEKDILANLKKVCEKEQIEYEEDALKLIAKSAEGHVRDSLSVLEQLSYERLTADRVSAALGLATYEQVFELLNKVVAKDIQGTLVSVEDIVSKGNPAAFLKTVVGILCYLCTFDEGVEDSETTEFRAYCSALRKQISMALCVKLIGIVTNTLRDNRGLGLDLAIRLCFLSMIVEEDKEDKIARLESEVADLRKKLELVNVNSAANSLPLTSLVAAKSSTEELALRSDISPVSVGMDENGNVNEWMSVVNDGTCPFNSNPVTDIPSSLEEETLETVPFEGSFQQMPLGVIADMESSVSESSASESSVPFSIPGGVIRSEEEMVDNSNKSAVPFSIPGGTVHLKEKTTEAVKEEVPVTDGQFISSEGFSDVGSFGCNLFGSTNARLF